jgi:hypothetical protein
LIILGFFDADERLEVIEIREEINVEVGGVAVFTLFRYDDNEAFFGDAEKFRQRLFGVADML